MTSRLTVSSLPSLPSSVVRPPDRRLAAGVGIVHLGLGAFHRVHQALYVEDAVARLEEPGWGICAVAQRSRGLLERLRAQDGLYSVIQRDGEQTHVRVVGQVSHLLHAADDAAQLRMQLADPSCRLVTLTVTEKGYRRDASGGLDLDDEVVRHDLVGGDPLSAVGQLVRGLQARSHGSGAPLTVLSCDNLINNGPVTRRLVEQFCEALPCSDGGELWSWIASNVTFPASMVDRIAPASLPEDRVLARQLLGRVDEAVVTTETFTQWVVEDAFAAARPRWESVGVEMVADVRPHELLKLRVVNGAHSMLAYLGQLRGHATIAEAMQDAQLAEYVRRFILEDVGPTLRMPEGVELKPFMETVLTRFANPHLRHTTRQVAADGSQKISERLLRTIEDRLAHGASAPWATMAVAAWVVCVERAVHTGGLELQDPLAATLRATLRTCRETSDVVESLLALRAVFPESLSSQCSFQTRLVESVDALRKM